MDKADTMDCLMGAAGLDGLMEYRVRAWMKELGIDEDTPLMPREIAPMVAEFAKKYYADAMRLIEQYENARVIEGRQRVASPLFTTQVQAAK